MFSDSPKNIDNLLREGYSTDIGRYIGRGWEIFQKNALGFIGFLIVCGLISIGLGAFPEKIKSIGSLISVVISGPLVAGFFIVAFKVIKQRATTFGDFFRGFNNFLPLFLSYLLVSIFVAIGLILLIIPGIYLAVAYMFTTALIVERKMDFWEAMETSRKVISKQWFSFFGFVLLLIVINIVGALLLGLGLLVTVPLTYCAIAAAYEDILGLSASSDNGF